MSTILITQLLDKTTDFDKDERYMATSDLCNELQKDLKIDASLERKICSSVLKQLDDNSNDVQSIAVKCLGILVTKVQESQVGDICDKLCGLILEGKSELRDIYSIGLKTLVSDVPESMGSSISTRLCNRLLGGIVQEKLQDVQLECLDILTDLLKRFGHTVSNEHDEIMVTVLRQLTNQRHVVRKRATACLGSLGVVLSDSLLNRLLDHLLTQIQAPRGGQDVRTLIQTIGTLSRTVGHRLGRHLDTIIPLFQKFCGSSTDETMQSEQANELRENCLQGFESFVLRCPREVTAHIANILRVVMDFIQYDPNYSYGDSEEEQELDDQGDEEFSDEEAGDYSDDDDTSWKVRRAALRVLAAIIASRPEMLSDIYCEGSDILISRFKEREENVRIDVLSCFSDLLGAVVISDGRTQTELQQNKVVSIMPAPRLTRQRSCIVILQEKIPAIIRAANKQLGPKGTVKSKCAVFSLLRQLANVARGGLAHHMDVLIPSIEKAAEDRNSTLKLDSLTFLRLLMETHPPAIFHPHMQSIIPHVVHSAAEDWYKIISEALRLIGTIVRVLRPYNEECGLFDGNFDFSPYVMSLYHAVMPRLSAHDIDQEIKECAISSMGEIISHLGDSLTKELNEVLPLLMDRLQNEITRMSTLKALASIARSPLKVDLTSILDASVTSLSTFLRQQSRSLKHATLDTLNELVLSNGPGMSKELFERIIDESSNLISDSDLHLSHLSLRLTKGVLSACPTSIQETKVKVLPKALQLACSPVLQGHALQSLLSFFKEIVRIDQSDAAFDALLEALLQPVVQGVELPKQAIVNIARCVAILSVNTKENKQHQTVKRFIDNVKCPTNDVSKHLALLCLGEIGKQSDLSSHTDLQQVILQSFDTGSEESKAAAAYALGNVSVGNMNTYLQVILSALGGGSNQYLLLSSLKEVISCHSLVQGLDFTPYVDLVLPILRKHCENPEEGVRNMVAECLGRLAIIDPDKIVPVIMELCSRTTPLLTRWTAVTSLKYGMTSIKPVAMLNTRIKNFLLALEDEDITVRRAALLTLNSAAHHQPQLIQDHMVASIFPILLQTMEIKMERVVDLGPFKHKVDDGLVLRKAAFSCVDTIIDTLPERVDIPSFLPHLKIGLADQDDVQMLCHQILTKISVLQPGALIGALDMLIDPLDKSVNRKVKDTQVGTEVERTNDLIRSALRAVDALSLMPDVGMDRKFQEFLERIARTDKLSSMLASIKAERGEVITERQ